MERKIFRGVSPTPESDVVPVVIGQRGHMEVRGLTEDHPGCEVILSEADLDTMVPRPRLGTGRDRVHHVQTAADLQEGWFDDARTVGITAGTSTPDSIIDEIEKALERIAAGACRHELAAA